MLSYYERKKIDKELDFQLANYCGDSDSLSDTDSDSGGVARVLVVGGKRRGSVAGLDDEGASAAGEGSVSEALDGVGSAADEEDGDASTRETEPIAEDEKESFLTALRNYSVRINVTLVQITYLLVMLARFVRFAIPKCAQTVMKLPVKTHKTISVAPGHYIHIGVEEALKHVPVSVTELDKVILHFNLDGVSMTESPVSCS